MISTYLFHRHTNDIIDTNCTDVTQLLLIIYVDRFSKIFRSQKFTFISKFKVHYESVNCHLSNKVYIRIVFLYQLNYISRTFNLP